MVVAFLANRSTGQEEPAVLARFLAGLLDPVEICGEVELALTGLILMASSSGISPVSSQAWKKFQV